MKKIKIASMKKNGVWLMKKIVIFLWKALVILTVAPYIYVTDHVGIIIDPECRFYLGKSKYTVLMYLHRYDNI